MRQDPATFDPEVAREWRRIAPHDSLPEDVEAARETLRAFFDRVQSRPTRDDRSGVTAEDGWVPSLIDDHRIPVRIYRPDAPVNGRALVYLHGGAFYMGDLDVEDESCHTLAREAACVVVSVDYRLAPEHTFPVPLEDCYSALRWVAENADELEVDRARVGVGGCSAGGALAAGLALLARDRSGPELALQLLLYPALDLSATNPALALLTDDERRQRARTLERYLGLACADAPRYASPMSAEDLRGLPPAYIACGELDLLRDEAIVYAQRLLDAGVSTELHLWARVPHTFELVVPDTRLARRSIKEQSEAVARMLG
jgi:acetyl esterase